ncbi:MAG: hypothetical protein KGV51_06570 [Moraxellaceae bacterium]|nr:hypothetical protein [Moraxellaceae bacterium]
MAEKKINSFYSYREQCYDSQYSTEMNVLIDTDIVKVFMPYLKVDEKILWTAKPNARFSFHVYQLIFVPIFLMMFWLFSMGMPPKPINTVGSIVSCIFLSYPIIGYYFVDLFRRSKITYAITNQRIFIRLGIFIQEVKTFNFNNLARLQLKANRDNVGSIILGNPPKRSPFAKRNYFIEMAGFDGIPKIEHIEKVQEVYNLISRFQAEKLAKKD